MKDYSPVLVQPGSFDPEAHYYPRVLNAQKHPVARYFLSLTNAQIVKRYVHLNPAVKGEALAEILASPPRYFRWAGADLFHASTDAGTRRMVVVETNSSPSGQKSMPFEDHAPQGGYRVLLERSFLPMLQRRGLPRGGLAVIVDKNDMETRGYAAVMAELTEEPVWWVPFYVDDPDPSARFVDGVLEVRDGEGEWHPIRAAFKYVTQRPWSRIPPITKTAIFNPVVACLAGGRNKLMAAKAYDLYNARIAQSGLQIQTPETIWDVGKREVPLWVERLGGRAVVKVPYSNAGQGVYTITNDDELDAFMAHDFEYDLFIVQSLVGNIGWSSFTRGERLYHIGTVPNRHGHIYAADIRFMVGAGPEGFFPLGLYSRRARVPLAEMVAHGRESWGMLGTNLSVKQPDGTWTTEPERLLLVDQRDFNRLGIGLDDLTEAYVQTALAATAIDKMAQRLVTQRGVFRHRFFATLNPDDVLGEEIMR